LEGNRKGKREKGLAAREKVEAEVEWVRRARPA
jgi:hypothetical protein